MASIQAEGSAADQLHALAGFWNLSLKHIDYMCLKCALELGIPDIIHNHGQPMSLPELLAALALPLPSTKSSQLRRVMRVLTHSGFFSKDVGTDGEEDVYLLTPVSLLVVKETKSAGLLKTQFVLDKPFQFMSSWFRSSDSPTTCTTPFKLAHGHDFWDEAEVNPEVNATFNSIMAHDSSLLFDVLVNDCGDVFRGLGSLVDVGGGTGSAARAIAGAFPQVKCSVLDLPRVLDTVPKDGMVEFIAGDMFEYVPPANAVLLKWIMHDWGDEDCIRILRRCKAAIPSKEEGGKVIIIDLVVGSNNSDPKSMKTQLYWDMMMLVNFGGVERDELEWKKIFIDSGFTDYKISPVLGLRSIIEVYP